jgi:TolB-like protein
VQPPAELIRAQLERIVASPQFAGSARMSRFLRYVVERTLAGEGERLKEYVIGAEVFDRDASYDPRVDSIVRVEAGRLRGKLEDYYRGAGDEDSVRIGLKKGSYMPQFEQRQAAAAPPPAATRRRGVLPFAVAGAVLLVAGLAWIFSRPSPAPAAGLAIAVLPFAPYGADAAAAALGEQLTEGVTAALVRQGGRLGVVPSARAARYRDPRSIPDDVGQQLGAQFLLRGRVMEADGQLRVEVLMMDGALTRKMWVESFVGSAPDLHELAQRIAAAASAAVARDLARR